MNKKYKWPVFVPRDDCNTRSVYLLKALDRCYKIGFAINLIDWLWNDTRSAITNNCEFEITPMAEYITPNYREIESALHEYYKAQRIGFSAMSGGSEWFLLDEMTVTAFIDKCLLFDGIQEKLITVYNKTVEVNQSSLRGLFTGTYEEYRQYEYQQSIETCIRLSTHSFFTGKRT